MGAAIFIAAVTTPSLGVFGLLVGGAVAAFLAYPSGPSGLAPRWLKFTFAGVLLMGVALWIVPPLTEATRLLVVLAELDNSDVENVRIGENCRLVLAEPSTPTYRQQVPVDGTEIRLEFRDGSVATFWHGPGCIQIVANDQGTYSSECPVPPPQPTATI